MFLTNTFSNAIISATVTIQIKIYGSYEYFVASGRAPVVKAPLPANILKTDIISKVFWFLDIKKKMLKAKGLGPGQPSRTVRWIKL